MPLRSIPSVDRVLRSDAVQAMARRHGHAPVAEAIRLVLSDLRGELAAGGGADTSDDAIAGRVQQQIEIAATPTQRRVFNLTGTVLHTNLGRAPLADAAGDAIARAAMGATNLEFDLARGGRGERDDHLEPLICRLTGAEAATVVNNNAAAVLLVLNTLALRKEVPTSRGELIEIGGSFRLPEIMQRAGARLHEVGTTNRTHLADYAAAIGPKTGLVMKVHTSNYAIVGFTADVPEAALAALCREHGVPLAVDLGSGTLVDLARYGLPHEPTPSESLRSGVDLVTFSGDKLLGGPQAGIVAGRADLIARLRRNPLKRALRVDKITTAALAATLRLYLDPDRLPERLPALRLLTRPVAEIRAAAERLAPKVDATLRGIARTDVVDCASEVGSGALPARELPSAGLAIVPLAGGGQALARIAAAFRQLPVPVIGRIHRDALILDLRCLDDEAAFADQVERLVVGG